MGQKNGSPASPASENRAEKNVQPQHSPSTATDQAVIAVIPRGPGEEIRVARTEYRGKAGIDVRVFERYRTTGEMGPARAGVRLAPELLPDLIAALTKAQA